MNIFQLAYHVNETVPLENRMNVFKGLVKHHNLCHHVAYDELLKILEV